MTNVKTQAGSRQVNPECLEFTGDTKQTRLIWSGFPRITQLAKQSQIC
jgi:hypothetical protein